MALTLGCSDIGIRKSEFVAKTQFLLITLSFNSRLYKHLTKNKIKLCSATFNLILTTRKQANFS